MLLQIIANVALKYVYFLYFPPTFSSLYSGKDNEVKSMEAQSIETTRRIKEEKS